MGLSSCKKCILSNIEDETITHLFHQCNFMKQDWQNHAQQTKSQYFDVEKWAGGTWLTHLQDKDSHFRALILITCWLVCKAKNEMLLKEGQATPAQISRETFVECKLMQKALMVKPKKDISQEKDICAWKKPTAGQIKFSTGGAWSGSNQEAGIGCVACNSNRDPLVTAAAHHICSSILMSELLATRSAWDLRMQISLMADNEFSIQSDSLEANNAIK